MSNLHYRHGIKVSRAPDVQSNSQINAGKLRTKIGPDMGGNPKNTGIAHSPLM